jgi:excisionase family DNA binding protein
MISAPPMARRLLRTKQAASYLSISEWKLRRLIQDAIFPVVQSHGGGPFLLDVRDLDAYIENNKHHIDEAMDWRPRPVAAVQPIASLEAVRRSR